MATTTFLTTGTEDAALTAAFGRWLNLGRAATQTEIKAATANWWRSIVAADQREQAAIGAAITPIVPT